MKGALEWQETFLIRHLVYNSVLIEGECISGLNLSCFSQISYLITPLDLSSENHKNPSISLSFCILF